MIGTILELILKVIDLVKWFTRPAKKVKKLEEKGQERKAKDAELVKEGTDEEMADRIRNI